MTRARSRSAWSAGALILAAAVLSGAAAPEAPASGSVTVLQSLKLTRVAGLSFGKLHTDNGHGVGRVTVSANSPPSRWAENAHLLPGHPHGPATTVIQGEPGRLYRVTLPAQAATSDGQAVGVFTLWSDARGDVTASGVGQIGPNGADTLRIGATLAVPPGTRPKVFTADVPFTVSYE